MAFAPSTTRCAALVLALWLGLTACAPGPAPPSTDATAAKATAGTPAPTGSPIPTRTPTLRPTGTPTPSPAAESPVPATPSPQASATPSPLYSVETEGPIAENLTVRCRMDASRGIQPYIWRIHDEYLSSFQVLKAGQWVSLAWDEDVPVRAVYLAFLDYPNAYRIRQFDADGALIREEAGPGFINHAVFLEAGTRSVTLLAEQESSLSAMYAFGEGNIPNYHPWEPTPEKLDYLIVATHPDDDVLFMGAILPLYTVDQGREGSVFYAAIQNRVRKDEAQNGAWVMGLRTAPILGPFPDILPQSKERFEHLFSEDKVILHLVRLFRQYRPEVVFSHDVYGEYGHWQHVRLSKAVRRAIPLAAKKSYDPTSAREYGVWRVKKLYLHLYAKNKISLPVEKPIAAYGGLTPVEIAAAAFQCHSSQLDTGHAVWNEGFYSLSDFGLAYTAVGPDTPGRNDPFEHIDPATIRGAGPAGTPAP